MENGEETPDDRSVLTKVKDNWKVICELIHVNKVLIEKKRRSYDGLPVAFKALAYYNTCFHEKIAQERIKDMVSLLDAEIQEKYPTLVMPQHQKHCEGPFEGVAELVAHQKVITGLEVIADRLYTASKDGWFKIWCCNTREILHTMNIGSEIGAMISSGSWIIFGLCDSIKCLHCENNIEVNLNANGGKILSLLAGIEYLYAGAKDGTLLSFKFSNDTFVPAITTKAHSQGVVALAGQGRWLMSSSLDSYVKVSDAFSFECVQIIQPHRSFVTAVLSWENHVVTSALDKSFKIWLMLPNGNLQHVKTVSMDKGVLSLKAFHDPFGNPTLVCGCEDSSVRVFELPSLMYKGWMQSSKEVRLMCTGGGNSLFFTGDGSGRVRIWKWQTSQVADEWFK